MLDRGEAKWARPVAEERAGLLDQGPAVAARQGLERLQVPVGGGSTKLPLSRVIPPGQLIDLEDILESFSS